MDLDRLTRRSAYEWEIAPHGAMRVPAVIFASEALVREMDQKVYEQVTNVATLPGIVKASYAMPDAHWGYGFPIGGVAAFDPDEGGVVSAGGVGIDISCGVRCLHTRLARGDVTRVQKVHADKLASSIPAGLGSTGTIRLNAEQMDAMLAGGAKWAVDRGWGEAEDLDRIAKGFGMKEGDIVVMIHCGSRGLGHQIGTDFLRKMAVAAAGYGIALPDRELACAPILSDVGEEYLSAMRAAINCALANRQILTHLVRDAFADLLPSARLSLLYDVSHNTCNIEEHRIDGKMRNLYVHRKGATRAFGPGHPGLPVALRSLGQPVLIGGSMGTGSYVLAGTAASEACSFSSACHGAGRAMSRHQALRSWNGRAVVDQLAARGILIRSPSMRGVGEEAPGAYKDVSAVVDAADAAGLARKVARLEPLICIKG